MTSYLIVKQDTGFKVPEFVDREPDSFRYTIVTGGVAYKLEGTPWRSIDDVGDELEAWLKAREDGDQS